MVVAVLVAVLAAVHGRGHEQVVAVAASAAVELVRCHEDRAERGAEVLALVRPEPALHLLELGVTGRPVAQDEEAGDRTAGLVRRDGADLAADVLVAGQVTAFEALPTDFAGALIDPADLRGRLVRLLAVAVPQLPPDAGRVAVAAALAPADRVFEGDGVAPRASRRSSLTTGRCEGDRELASPSRHRQPLELGEARPHGFDEHKEALNCPLGRQPRDRKRTGLEISREAEPTAGGSA